EHHLLQVSAGDKKATATRIAARDGQVIMFLDTKRAVDAMVEHLLANGVRAGRLHGGRSQPQRTRTLRQFKEGEVTALVATNVAARGIHVGGLDLVVNIDPPADHKDYLHRGGRTARAGESGSVVTLVLPHQNREMSRMMDHARIDAKVTQVRPDDAELARLTGARTPSGVPVRMPAADAASPAPRAARGRRRPRRQTLHGPLLRRTAAGRGPPFFRPLRPGRPAPRTPRSASTAPRGPTVSPSRGPGTRRRLSAAAPSAVPRVDGGTSARGRPRPRV